jgi:hypothetical protein
MVRTQFIEAGRSMEAFIPRAITGIPFPPAALKILLSGWQAIIIR